MKNTLIKSVKHYSLTMLNKDIFVTEDFEFEDCRVSSIEIDVTNPIIFIINVENSSLEKLSKHLFDFVDEEIKEDLQKEIVNTISGYFSDHFFKKGYKLGLPNIQTICDTKYGLFFKNDILKLCIRLKVK